MVIDMTDRTDYPAEWLTPAMAAAILGVTTKTVARLADDGKLRVLRPTGSHRRYKRHDVEALVKDSAGK